MPRGKWKLALWLIGAIIFLHFTLLSGIVIKFHRDYRSLPSDHRIGNKSSNVAVLRGEGFPFSFLVIGDTSGSETTETLIEMAQEKGNASFIVLLGDFVRRPDIWNHRFFLTEMAIEIRPPFPVFLVPGNHDIDYMSRKIRDEKRRVTPEIYDSLYGARDFDFVFNNCLFIICGVDLNNKTRHLNYLRNTLSQKREGKKHVFIFIHYPPKGLAGHIKGSLPIPNEEEFFSLLTTHKATACFFGDYHGYWRGQREGVSLIVSGGGGRLKSSQPEWGKFQHILRITVDRDKFAEEIITIQEKFGLEDWFEEQVFLILFPVIQGSVWILYVIVIILLLASGFLFFNFLRAVRHG